MTRWSACAAALLLACQAAPSGPSPHPVEFGAPCEGSDCAPEIPMTGRVSPAFRELDIAMRQFMKFRCVGAGVLSVSLRGRRVYKRGFGRMAGAAAPDLPGCSDGALAGRDPYAPEAAYVLPDTPIPVGSVSKTVTAAMIRELVAARISARGLTDVYPTPTHARVFDPALELLPRRVLDAVAGIACGPVTVAEDGVDCERACGDAGPDVRLRDVTVGDLLAHTSGLTRSAADWEDWVVPRTGLLRGYTSEADFAAEDAALRGRYPAFAGRIDATRAWLARERGIDAPIYFVSRYDARDADPQDEWMRVYLTRCLTRAPAGANDDGWFAGGYSNTNYAVLSRIVAHLTGKPYAAEVGHPEQHAGSYLAEFVASLGIDGGVETREAIFHRPRAAGAPGETPTMPEPRAWNRKYRAYTWLRGDLKRPFCVWTGDGCDFSRWLDDETLHSPWDFATGAPRGVGLDQYEQAMTIGTGALAVEAPALLRVIHLHAVGNNDIVQGRLRGECGAACARTMVKNGGQGGARAYVMSLVGDSGTVDVSALDAHGRLTDAGAHTEVSVQDTPGVDFVVSIAQSADGRADGAVEYAWLDDIVRYGLSRVDWPRVEAELAAQADTAVGMRVDAGATTYWLADDTYERRGGAPRGPGAGPLLESAGYVLPATRIGPDVLAIAAAPDRGDDTVIAWYDDGHASVGTVARPGAIERSFAFTPAAGYVYSDIVGVAVRPDGEALAVYRDGGFSRGTASELGAGGTGELALPGRDAADIAAIALDGDELVVLFSDGTTDRDALTAIAPE